MKLKHNDEMQIDFDRAFKNTPVAFSQGLEHMLSSMDQQFEQKQPRAKLRQAWLLAAVLSVCLASLALAAHFTGLLELFLPVTQEAQHMVQFSVAEAVKGDSKAVIQEVLWDGETLAIAYTVDDPILAQVAGFVETEGEEVRLSTELDQYAFRHMAQEIRIEGHESLQPDSMDIRWGDSADQVVYYMETMLRTEDAPYEISLIPYSSEGALPLAFMLSAPNTADTITYAIPEATSFEGYTAQIIRHVRTPLRTYVDMEITMDDAGEVDRVKEIASLWGFCGYMAGETGCIPMNGTASLVFEQGTQRIAFSYSVKSAEALTEDACIVPLDNAGNVLGTAAIPLFGI